MAFKKVNPTNLQGLLAEVVTFCKTDLTWHSVTQSSGGYLFQPRADSGTFEVNNIRSGKVTTGRTGSAGVAFTTFDLRNTRDSTHKTNIGWVTGIKNAWLKGNEDGLFCVIETSSRNFKWFGFGDIPKLHSSQLSNIQWCIGSFIAEYYLEREINYIDRIKNQSLFGANATSYLYYNNIHNYYYDRNTGNSLYYGNNVYRDVDYYSSVNMFGGGSQSVVWKNVLNYGSNRYLGGVILAKTPLFIRSKNNDLIDILCEVPFVYACQVQDDICPLEVTFGGKRYIVFNVGSNRKDFKGIDITSDNIFKNNLNADEIWLTETRTGDNCFALCMDDD